MFFDDDDGDFSPAVGGGSKLSSLFGMASSSAGSNESLTYTAPKQPKSKENGSGANGTPDGKAAAPSVLNAVAVHAFRFINGQYATQGKLGMAILGDHKNRDYKILLYISQKKPVAAAKIHNGFNFTVQKNNYATFYDDQSQLWSICFESNAQATEFGKWVCLAKFNCSPIGLLIQDLAIGDGQTLQKGDTAELQYTGYLYINQTFGKVFESNKESGKLYKIKLGRGKVIKGWEEGIPGMKKGGKRLLIIPPGLAYGSKGVGDRIPANAILIFEVDVTRAKFAVIDPTASEESSRTASPDATQTQPSTPSDTKKESIPISETKEESKAKNRRSESVKSNKEEEKKETLFVPVAESVKGRTHSITEQLSKSLEKPSGKANLLARMSKMGQSLIPTSPAKSDQQDPMENAPRDEHADDIVSHEHERATLEDVKHEPESPSKPVLKPRPDPMASHASTAQSRQPDSFSRTDQPPTAHQAYNPPQAQQQLMQPLAVYQPPNPMFGMNPMQSIAYGNPMPVMQAAPASSGFSSTEISLVLTEGKLHHGEMKSAVSRVAERIDSLIAKVDQMERNERKQESNLPMITGGIEMEASVLSSNINRILQENEKLKRENLDKTTKIESLNEKISDMLFKNQSFLEKSNLLMEERADSIKVNANQAQAKVNSLEQQNATLSSQMMSLKTRLGNFESELEDVNGRESELKSKFQKLKEERDSARERLDSASSNVSDHKEEIEQMKNKYKEEKQENKKLKTKIDHLEEELQEIKQEKESVDKALTERKKKQKSDMKKFDEEIEDIKNSHEEEIRSLKQRYKKGSLENEKLAALEAELEKKHQENLKRTLKDAERRWEEKLEEIANERNGLQNANYQLTDKIKGFKCIEEKNEDLVRTIAQLQENNNKATKALNEEKEDQQNKAKDLLESIERKENEAFLKGLEKGKTETATESSNNAENSKKSAQNVGDEVKKVMNGVFFQLKNEFEPEGTYTGRDIVKEILQTIRNVTMKMTETRTTKEDEEDDGGEEDDAGEEDLSEDEDESDYVEEEDDSDGDSEESEVEDEAKEESEVEDDANEESEVEDDAKEESEVKDDEKEESEVEDDAKEESEVEDDAKEESEVEDDAKNENPVEVDAKEDSEVEEDGQDESEVNGDVQNKGEIEDHAKEESAAEDIAEEEDEVKENIKVQDVANDDGESKMADEVSIQAESESEDSATEVLEEDANESATTENDTKNAEEANTEKSESVDLVDQDNERQANDTLVFVTKATDFVDAVIEAQKEEVETNKITDLDGESVTENNSINETKLANTSELFSQSAGNPEKEADTTTVKENGKLEKIEKASTSKSIGSTTSSKNTFDLSDDDRDDGIFSESTKKKSAAAAFSRSPPPLFDDDDEDTNWI